MNVLKATAIFSFVFSLLALAAAVTAKESDEDKKQSATKMQATTLARGAVTLSVPVHWKAQKLRSRILEREYAIPAAKGDQTAGRLTMMSSGGSVEANVNRWIGQFTQPDGASTKERTKVTDKKINGQEVKIVEISGTFKESQGGGPFAPGRIVERQGYQMLAAIVQTKGHGQYFFKLYGPRKTVASAKKSFMAMMNSVASKP